MEIFLKIILSLILGNCIILISCTNDLVDFSELQILDQQIHAPYKKIPEYSEQYLPHYPLLLSMILR